MSPFRAPDSFLEQGLCSFEFFTPAGAQIVASAVDVRRQHSHAGSRAFWGNTLGCKGLCDGGGVFIEQSARRKSRFGLDSSGPATWRPFAAVHEFALNKKTVESKSESNDGFKFEWAGF
jgi:hypothetical protein